MMDDLDEQKTFELPILESKHKPKKGDIEYKQYSVKLPKKLVKLLKLDKEKKFKITLKPLEAGQKIPDFNIELL